MFMNRLLPIGILIIDKNVLVPVYLHMESQQTVQDRKLYLNS